MSSILEALKKLEEDKAEATQPFTTDMDSDEAERDLIGPDTRFGQSTIRVTPKVVMLGVVATVVLLAATSLGTVLVIKWLRAPVGTEVAEVSPKVPLHADPTPSREPLSGILATPMPQADRTDASGLLGAAPVSAGGSSLRESRPPEVLPEAAVHAGSHAPDSVSSPETSRTISKPPRPSDKSEEPIRDPQRSSTEPANYDVNLSALPVLSDPDRMRLGLVRLQVNMVRMASKTRPHASAIINLKTVYIGEQIPGTRVALIGVERSGVGIEIEGSGERFYVPF